VHRADRGSDGDVAMHKGLTLALVGLVSLSLLVSACDAEEPDALERPAARQLEVFEPADVPAGSSGSVVAVAGGEIVTCQGWGQADHEAGASAGCRTVYDIGSVTKQFTAAAVVKLQTQGRLQVTDEIGRFFDGVPQDKRDITVHHLLTHTAGLVEALGDDYDPLTRQDMVAGAMASELTSRPGAR
jgi:CubicO group peptidase (beta-lactamase class C family)